MDSYIDKINTFWWLTPVNGTAIKVFERDGVDVIKISDYNSGFLYRPDRQKIRGLANWLVTLRESRQSFLVWGWPTGEKRKVIRRLKEPRPDEDYGNTWLSDRLISVFPIDVDNFNGTVDDYILNLPPQFHKSAYVCAYSSSYKISAGLRCHLIFELSMPMLVSDMRKIAKNINKDAGIKLLDPAIYQPQQPYYCAPPIFVNPKREILPDIITERVFACDGGCVDSESLYNEFIYRSDGLFSVYIPGEEATPNVSAVEIRAQIGVTGHHMEGLRYANALAFEGKSVDEIYTLLQTAFNTCNRMGKSEQEFKIYLSHSYLKKQSEDAIKYASRRTA